MFARLLTATLLSLFLSLPAAAAEHARLLSDYSHQAWGAAQGAPAQVQAITQTPDGWLWLSTPTGLYRFDGVNFERRDQVGGQPLLSTIVLPLHTTPDGGLWVGYRFGGVSVFKDGKATHYGAGEGFPGGAAHSFTTAPDGVLWATSARGLARLDRARNRWVQIGPDTGFNPTQAIWQVLFDHAGTQWVSTSSAVYYRRAGDTRYRVASPANMELASLAAAPDGTVWISNGVNANYRLSQTPPQSGAPAPKPELPGSGMWFDRQGTMWLASETHLERMLPDVFPDPRQRITPDQGLSGLNPQTFFEDRDGNVWIGTATGLDRFRRNRITPLPSHEAIVTPALAADAGGKVWLSNARTSAWLMDAAGQRHATLDTGFWSSAAKRNSRNATGAVLGSYQGIWHAGRIIAPQPPEVRDPQTLYALAQDRAGDWWASYLNHDLFRYRDGKWEHPYPSLPKLRVMSLLSDSRDRLWIGYPGNRIAVVEGGKPTLMGAEQGLNIGNVLCIYERGGNLWVAGESGAARYDGKRFVPLLTADGHELRGISGIVATDNGELWLHGNDGAYRIGAAQLRAFVRDGAKVAYELLGSEEGIGGTVQPIGPFPSMVQADDGKLWLSSTSGAMLITPGAIRRDPIAPPVEIRSLASNGKHYPVDRAVLLPAGANNLQIGYTALGLSVPTGAFRYRLDGVDEHWQNPEGRREAFYTNLAPGRYRFQVIAANRDGVWNMQGAALDIAIPPTFLQSVWFKLLCGATLIGLVVLAWRSRVAQLANLIEARQLERLAERERIARALHDTFLQQAQGTILMMQAAMEQVPPALPARAAMERGIGYIERALVEGRDEVMGLRSAKHGNETLAEALERFGASLADGLPARFRLDERGVPFPLAVAIRDEVYAIGREAICNAFRHADAGEIVVDLDYGAAALTLRVADDGKGIPPDILDDGQRKGHYGLVGMRERAVRLGAVLEIGNGGERGGFVRLTVPRTRA